MPPRVLVLHGLPEVARALRKARGGLDVVVARDLLDAKAQAHDPWAALVVEHPFMGLEAPMVLGILRGAGVKAPAIVAAVDLPRGAREPLLRAVASGGICVGADAAAIAEAVLAVISGPTAAVAVAPEDRDLLAELGDEPLALRTDDASFHAWVVLNLPPRLIASLDGTRSVQEIVGASGEAPATVLVYLRVLRSLGCLEQGVRARPVVSAEVWLPPVPFEPPDELVVLGDVPPQKLLLGLRRREATGVAIVQAPHWTMRLDVAHGSVVRAGGGPDETSLGRVLHALGYLDEDAHHGLVAEHQRRQEDHPGLTLGDLAVELGLVTAGELHAGLGAQIEGKVMALVPVAEGVCTFWRDSASARWQGIAHRPVEALLTDALRRSAPRCRQLVGAFVAGHALDRALALPIAEELSGRFLFSPQVSRLVDALDGRVVADALRDSGLPADGAGLALYLLWAAGGVELEPAG